jgi:hypothetical protein
MVCSLSVPVPILMHDEVVADVLPSAPSGPAPTWLK